ncbi:MAG: aspartate aminotransferase family protein [Rhodoglobus sp.]
MTYPLERFAFKNKTDVLAAASKYWNPAKTQFWQDAGVPLVIGDRHDYMLRDIDGHELIDMHLNGGTYNLGHRNAAVIAAVTDAMSFADIGNHHFPAIARTALARELVESAPSNITKALFGSSGGEAIDAALKCARFATGRRKIVSIENAYHGHTGLAVAAGSDRYSTMFHSDQPADFVRVPFNDIEAMAEALAVGDIAAVIVETIPATSGFPMPAPGYLAAVKALAEEQGTLYVADEVQTGLGRTGSLWAITKHGVEPDIIVTGKGLGGGIYPVSAVLLSERPAGWLEFDGFGHIGTFGGSEIGAVAALTVLAITRDPATVAHVDRLSAFFGAQLAEVADRYPGVVTGIRQDGLVIGIEFEEALGAQPIMRALYERGVWAIFSSLDPSVLQFKPGLLLDMDAAERVISILDDAVSSVVRHAS